MSEALSRRVAASKAEVEKLREEYERLLEAGVNGSTPEDVARTEEAAARTSGRTEELGDEGKTSPTKKKRTYDVHEVREYMRKKQREKQLEHVQRQLRKTESDVDAKKRRLRELQEKSRNIVAKNTRNRSRSRSRDSRRDDVKPAPVVAPEPTGGGSTARVATPEIVHPVDALPVVRDAEEEDAGRRNRAAVVIQANFKGYKARSSYRLRLQTRRRELEREPKRPKSEWLETDPQSYPYNFISVVKRKLNLAVRTPVRSTEDATVQITPQMSVSELKEKIEASIRKTESRKVDEMVEPEGETSKPKSLRSFLYDLDLKKVESMRLRSKGSDSDTSKNVPDLTSEYDESFESVRSGKDEALFKQPEVVLSLKSDTFKDGPRKERSSAPQSGKSDEKVLSSESVDLQSDINTASRERSSRGSKERSASSRSKKSSEKALSSESVDLQSDIITVSRLSRSSKEKSGSSQSKKLSSAASESDGVRSDSTQRSSRSSKERSDVSKCKVTSEVFEKPEIVVTSESDGLQSDVNRKASSRTSAASLKSESDGFHSDRKGSESDDFRLKIDTDRVRNLRLVRRKDRRDSHDNTLDYYRDGAASSSGSFRTLPSAAVAASSVSEEEEPLFSPQRLESRRNSIIVGMKCTQSLSAENSPEIVQRSSRADDDLASFRRYMRDFDESKKIRHWSSEDGGGAWIDTNSHNKYSSNFSSEGLVAPAMSLRRNGHDGDNSEKNSNVREVVPKGDGDNESSEKKSNVREVVLKAGEKKSVETTGNSNQIHVKFEAELRLLNDFNDSLRQYMDVEKSLLKLHNKTTSFETRDTQTSLVTKSASTSLLISKAASNSNPIRASRSEQNVPDSVVRSINTSRGDDFDSSKNVRTVTEDDAPDLRTDDGSSLIPSLNYTRGSEGVGSYLSMDPSAIMRLSDIMEVSCNETLEETAHVSHLSIDKEKPKNVYAGLSLGMFEQLIKDEDSRIENLKAILKIREKALLDRTKGELAWLEIQKKNLLETGKLHEASLVKKKQRGIIIKLQHEKHEMQKLKQLQKAASKERKTILREQRDMIKAQLSTTDGAVAKIKRTRERRTSSTGPINVYSYRRETVMSETSYSRRSSVADEAAVCSSKSDGVVGRKEEAVVEITSRTTEAARRSLLMREAALQKRREAVEELLRWHQRLRDDERKIADLEAAASNLISRGPMASFNGAQLNVLWENMTGRPDKKFADDETYELSQSALDRFCADAGAAKKSSMDEIAHNISSITDEISALYKLSSAGQNSNVGSFVRGSGGTASTNSNVDTLSYGFVNEKLGVAEDLIGPSSATVPKQNVDDRSSGISEDIARKKSASYRSSKSSTASEIFSKSSDSSDSHRTSLVREQSQQESVVSGSSQKSLDSDKSFEKLQTSRVEEIKSQVVSGSVTTQISEPTNKSAMKESHSSVASLEKSTVHETVSFKRDDPADAFVSAHISDEPDTHSISSVAGVLSQKLVLPEMKSPSVKESLQTVPEAASVATSQLSSPYETDISTKSDLISDEQNISSQKSVAELQEDVGLSVASFEKSRPEIDSPTSSIKTPSQTSDNSNTAHHIITEASDHGSVLSEKISMDTSSFKSNVMSDKQQTPSPKLDISPKSDVSEEQEKLSQKSAVEVSGNVESSLASFEKSRASVVPELESSTSFVQSIKSVSQDQSDTLSIQDGKLSVVSKKGSTYTSAELSMSDKQHTSSEKSVVEDTENADSSSYKSGAEQSSVLPEIGASNSGLSPPIEVPDFSVKLSDDVFSDSESRAKDCSRSKDDFIESSSVKSSIESYQPSAAQERPTPGTSAESSVESNESNQQESSAISSVKREQHLAVQEKESSESFPVQVDAFVQQMDVSPQTSSKSDDNSSRKSGKSMSSNRASIDSNIEPNSQISSAKPSVNILQKKSMKIVQKTVSSAVDNSSTELLTELCDNTSTGYVEEEEVSNEPDNIPSPILKKSELDGGVELDKDVEDIATPPNSVGLDKDAKNSRNSSVKRKSEEAEPASDENTSSEITDLISDDPAPVIEVIVEGKRDVRTRVSQILADANIGGNVGTIGSPRVQDLYVTTYDLISPDGSPELRSPTDENDTSTKDIFGNEAEELLRKQLAIEQEIKQLEQQQKEQLPYLYMREIPNKPPPPYTPPTQAPSTIPSTVLPLTVEQIGSVLPDVTDLLFVAQTQDTLSAVVLPEKLDIPGVDRACLEFVFDLCKEAAVEHYAQFEETSAPSWMKPQNKVGLKRKFNRAELERHLDGRLRRLFGFEKHDVKESMIIKWSRKRRDHVDELLVVESQAEEAEWTNYDQDERVVKNEAAKELLNMLLGETVDVFKKIIAKKKLKNTS